MDAISDTGCIWYGCAMPLIGLIGVIVARGRFAVQQEWVGAVVFFVCLAAVASMTVLALAATSNLWLAGGTNISLELSPAGSPPADVGYDYMAYSQLPWPPNSHGRTFTGKIRALVGCEPRHQDHQE